jgi:hypothetical protein
LSYQEVRYTYLNVSLILYYFQPRQHSLTNVFQTNLDLRLLLLLLLFSPMRRN